jgi:hypothetical protein
MESSVTRRSHVVSECQLRFPAGRAADELLGPVRWRLTLDEQANLLHLRIDQAAPTPELEVARLKAERVFGPNP